MILTGAYETAELFRSFRQDLPLLAETSGKNAVIVTPSADLDLAVKDVVASAFGHAGQKCSAASLVVMVGSVAKSKRFRNQLLDAVSSLTVGYPSDPTSQMGPIIEPAAGKLLDGLTTLGAGESWAVEPKQLDETGKLWSPGVRQGVRRASDFHRTEYFGPILGVMTAETLDEAIDIVNDVDYGLTSGLHSLDPGEIGTWLGRIQAGNLYVNRSITGAIVRRQPFGGWKKSAVGAGTKAGGVNYLVGLGSWASTAATAGSAPSSAVSAFVRATGVDSESLGRAVASDEFAWTSEFGVAADVSALTAERNVFRYLPYPGCRCAWRRLGLRPRLLRMGRAWTVSCGSSRRRCGPAPRSTSPSPVTCLCRSPRPSVACRSSARSGRGSPTTPSPRASPPGPPPGFDSSTGTLLPWQSGRTDARTSRCTPSRSPKPDGSRCCRSSASRRCPSRRTASGRRTTCPTRLL